MISSRTFELLDQVDAIPDGDGSRTAKMALLKANKDDLKEYFDIAFNPYRVFHVVQIPVTTDKLIKYVPTKLEELAKYLEDQKGGTNDSKSMVRLFLNHYAPLYGPSAARWCELAILKLVKFGVEIKSLNKCGFGIPEWGILKAAVNKSNSLEGVSSYPCYVQEKLDGCRAVYLPDKKVFMSSSGKMLENVQLLTHCEQTTDMVLDGEMYDPNLELPEIVGLCTSYDEQLPTTFKFHVFNALTVDEWRLQESSSNYTDQIERIKNAIVGAKNTSQLPTGKAKDAATVMLVYNKFVAAGKEGAMVRGMDSLYQWKKVNLKDDSLIKLKQVHEEDGQITGWYHGEKGGRHENGFGGFHVLMESGETVDVGGGYKDKQREEFFKNPDSYIGKWCIVRYTELTMYGKPQFPRFRSLRDSKSKIGV